MINCLLDWEEPKSVCCSKMASEAARQALQQAEAEGLTLESSDSNTAGFKGCAGCMCWVCDVAMGECCDWEEHCVCDASPEWAAARHMARRGREAKRVKLDPDD